MDDAIRIFLNIVLSSLTSAIFTMIFISLINKKIAKETDEKISNYLDNKFNCDMNTKNSNNEHISDK